MDNEENKIIPFHKYSKFDVFHPLFGKTKLTLNDLIHRSTPDAAKVLQLAKLFGIFRIKKQIEIQSLYNKLTAIPWTDKGLSINEPFFDLMTMDLARALIILYPDELIHRLFGTDIDLGFWNVNPKFKADMQEWSRVRRQLTSEERTLGIEKFWCRNWSWIRN